MWNAWEMQNSWRTNFLRVQASPWKWPLLGCWIPCRASPDKEVSFRSYLYQTYHSFERYLGSLLWWWEVNRKLDHTKKSKERATGTKDNPNLGGKENICLILKTYFLMEIKDICLRIYVSWWRVKLFVLMLDYQFFDAYQMTIEAWWLNQSKGYFNNCCSQAYEQQNRYEDSGIKKIIRF